MKKPKEISLYDGSAKCVTEAAEFNEAYGVEIEGFLYDSKSIKRLMKFLEKAHDWILEKETK